MKLLNTRIKETQQHIPVSNITVYIYIYIYIYFESLHLIKKIRLYFIYNLTITGLNCHLPPGCHRPCWGPLDCEGVCHICAGPVPWSRCQRHWNENGTESIESEAEI